jgi:hypothetical protein
LVAPWRLTHDAQPAHPTRIEGRAFTAPSFANGKVYVRNTKGDVVCLEFSSK